MNNINNKANQLIGKHKTTTSSQPNNSIPHASNSEYDGATSNKNSNDNFTLVTKQGGDFNSKHHSWGCRANIPRGQVLYNFVTRGNLKVLAPPGPTYWPTSARKNPDILDIFITKITNNIHCTTENILDLNSDHSSVLLTLNLSLPLRQESPKLFNRTTNKIKFHATFDQQIKLNIKLKSYDDLDLAVNNLTNLIQTAAWSSTVTSLNPSKTPAILVHIREIIVEKLRSKDLYQQTHLPSHKQKYNKLVNRLKNFLVKLKTKSLESFLTNVY
ncbi:Uncharacterized protein FWK35_00009874 [Aphis craccivora]|uniref:Endonuclease/exonuclease/phosphatase domain-containing protein n=1 Tax=Aphis craccivora TaxID=307492 RepID=A0A6G0ZM73_APHCR|nr:Uncharacterized protein FWK35_00009874 [Aphis craccivora]